MKDVKLVVSENSHVLSDSDNNDDNDNNNENNDDKAHVSGHRKRILNDYESAHFPSKSSEILNKPFKQPSKKSRLKNNSSDKRPGKIFEVKLSDKNSSSIYDILGKSFVLVKNSLKELDVYLECSAYFPRNFPRIYSFEVEEDSEGEKVEIVYKFEKMVHIYNSKFKFSPKLFDLDDHRSLVLNLKLILDSMFNLHLLHSKIGIIHRDISMTNIMYSSVDDMWKIHDFNLSLRAIHCKNPRESRVGTEGFVAPEIFSQGMYSEASDIYSLGIVCDRLTYHLRKFIILKQGEDCEVFRKLLLLDEIVNEMICENPSERPSLEVLLERVYKLLKNLLISKPDDPIHKHRNVKSVEFMISSKKFKETEQVEETEEVEEVEEAKEVKKLSTEKDIEISELPEPDSLIKTGHEMEI